MIGSLLALALAQSACAAPEGTAALLHGDPRFIVVGELHGTTETPAAFAAMVCEASQTGAVTVALELPEAMQPNLDAFLEADNDDAARETLRGTAFLTWIDDGRSSRAMLDMMQSLRRLRADGRDIVVRAIQPDSPRPPDFPQSYYELEMGYLLSRAAVDRPTSKVLVLVGSLHARKTRVPAMPHLGLPAAAHLPAEQTVSLYVVAQGGEAWNCAPCGVNPIAVGYDPEARGAVMGVDGDGAYDGILALGPSTASPPVSARED